jgi:hypothetical protein
MRNAALTIALIGSLAAPLAAEGRSNGRQQGIPPGHMPPPGQCRVWYDGRPPGQQPPPSSCREAERIASRDRYARVIYGGDRRDDRWERDDDRRGRGDQRYPNRYPRSDDRRYPDRYGYGYQSVPFDNGYKDGFRRVGRTQETTTALTLAAIAGIGRLTEGTSAISAPRTSTRTSTGRGSWLAMRRAIGIRATTGGGRSDDSDGKSSLRPLLTVASGW